MHVFLSCFQSVRKHPIAAYGYWENYFKRGLEEAGYPWVEARGVDWAEGLAHADPERRKSWRDVAWSHTLDQIRKQHGERPIDLFLSYLFPVQVDVAAVREIQAVG